MVNELVELLNLVYATARADLRELNETNFAIGCEAHAARGRTRRVVKADLEKKMDTGFAGLETKMALQSASLERALREQMRLLFVAWGVLVASSIAQWFR